MPKRQRLIRATVDGNQTRRMRQSFGQIRSGDIPPANQRDRGGFLNNYLCHGGYLAEMETSHNVNTKLYEQLLGVGPNLTRR